MSLDYHKGTCIVCSLNYDTTINIKTGDLDKLFCSDECGELYYKNLKENDELNSFERKLNYQKIHYSETDWENNGKYHPKNNI